MKAECFGCVDANSYTYHGPKYNGKETAERYIAAYEEMGLPVVECVSCGSRVRYERQDNGRWLQIHVGVSE